MTQEKKARKGEKWCRKVGVGGGGGGGVLFRTAIRNSFLLNVGLHEAKVELDRNGKHIFCLF